MRDRMVQPKYRVGVIVPSVNRVVEPEWQWALPDGVQMYVSRAQYQFTNPDPLQYLLDDARKASEDLRQCGVDIGVFACTGASFYHHSDGNVELTVDLSNRFNAPAVTASTAIVDALQKLKAKRITLITPYAEEDTVREVQYLSEHGISVGATYGMGIADAQYESEVPYEKTLESALDHWDKSTDAMLISCTNLFSWALVPEIEKYIGHPVITSNQSTVASVIDSLGLPGLDPNTFGSLFAVS